MEYKIITFNIKGGEEADDGILAATGDLLAALTVEAGLEAFEEMNDQQLVGYAQKELLDINRLTAIVNNFPIENVNIRFDVSDAENKDWNEAWEQEGFSPIIINDRLCIHDLTHLPTEETDADIAIDARQAFGTGTHDTTRMIVGHLMRMTDEGKLQGASVLDCGCGTGILAIAALKLGAAEAKGYDIDQWSVDNSAHNAALNGVDDRLQTVLGDATAIDRILETTTAFDFVLANINRNILLADMPQFIKAMKKEGGKQLILSGFYTADIPLLKEEAEELGLQTVTQYDSNDWACLVMEKA